MVSEASLLSAKISKFGFFGAGVITDSLAVLDAAKAREEASKEAANGGYPAPASPPKAIVPIVPLAARGKGATLSRDEVLEILAETVRVQGIVQLEVSALARKTAQELGGEGKKKKKRLLSFVDGHKKIMELGLPREPLDDYGLTESAFQKILCSYEEDEEVMNAASKLLHPASKGDPERAQGITIDKIVEIHQFMVVEMQKVLQEFLQLPQEQRRTFTCKGCETTAELLVSIAVENSLAVRCEDVEQAVIMCEEHLQGHPDFARCTEHLAGMMQHLTGAAQPRVDAAELVQILQHMGESTKNAKIFAKKLHEDYRAKACTIAVAYERFETFSIDVAEEFERKELAELSSMEMQLCYDEYRDQPEVREAWEQSGAESNLLMQNLMIANQTGNAPSRGSSGGAEEKKGKKLKASDIVEMQELMVDELKRMTDAVAAAVAAGASKERPWQLELVVQMVQALASAAVERRYGVSAEEMTMAGFQHAQVLQRNERFVRSTEKQQELLMRIPALCGSSHE